MPGELSPGVRRLLDQLAGTPVSVFDAAWTLLEWNPLFAALMGDPSPLRGRERNVVWRHFTGRPGRVRHTAEQAELFEAAVVADLRTATARYPSDPALHGLVAELSQRSPAFLRLWEEHAVGRHTTAAKTVEHPQVGAVTLDCDVLVAPDSDLRVVLYTAAPGTEAAEKLALLNVVGLQRLWA